MKGPQSEILPQTVHLAAGAQAVINGALVTAVEPCTLQVGSGAYVLTGRGLWRERQALRNPRDELYFSLLECAADQERFHSERFRLFRLLGEVVAQDRTHEAQRECAMCAAAIMGSDGEEAVESAARLASQSLVNARRRLGHVPGQRSKRRTSLTIGDANDDQERKGVA